MVAAALSCHLIYKILSAGLGYNSLPFTAPSSIPITSSINLLQLSSIQFNISSMAGLCSGSLSSQSVLSETYPVSAEH